MSDGMSDDELEEVTSSEDDGEGFVDGEKDDDDREDDDDDRED